MAGRPHLSPRAEECLQRDPDHEGLSFDALPDGSAAVDWFTGAIQGIRYRSDIASHSCCGTPPTINIRAELHAFSSDRWTAVGRLMALYIR
jgi:hypothetical protein